MLYGVPENTFPLFTHDVTEVAIKKVLIFEPDQKKRLDPEAEIMKARRLQIPILDWEVTKAQGKKHLLAWNGGFHKWG